MCLNNWNFVGSLRSALAAVHRHTPYGFIGLILVLAAGTLIERAIINPDLGESLAALAVCVAGWMLCTLGMVRRAQRKVLTLVGFLLLSGFVFVFGRVQSVATSGCCGHQVYRVKARMKALQLGVEQYAGDNYGHYPDGVLNKGFNWKTYVHADTPDGIMRNPYNQSITGSQDMESDMVGGIAIAKRRS